MLDNIGASTQRRGIADAPVVARAFQMLGIRESAEAALSCCDDVFESIESFIRSNALPEICFDLVSYERARSAISGQPPPRRPEHVRMLTPLLRGCAAKIVTAFPIGPFVRFQVADPLMIGRRRTTYLLTDLPYEASGSTALLELEEGIIDALLAGADIDRISLQAQHVTAALQQICEMAEAGMVLWASGGQ